MYKIGLDIGYGYTKGVNQESKKVCFPTLIASEFRNSLKPMEFLSPTEEEIQKNLVVTLSDGEKEQIFKVGDNAIIGKQKRDNLTENKINSIENKVCLATSSLLLLPEEKSEIFLVSGLPITNFNSQKDQFKSMLENFSIKASLPDYNISKEIKFTRVELVPQGLAAIYHSIWDNVEKYSIPGTYIGVIDWGHKTVDYAVFYIPENGIPRFIPEYSGTIKTGIFQIELSMNNIFMQNGEELDFNQLKLLTKNGKIFYKRKWIDLSKELDNIKQNAAMTVKNEISKRWTDILNYFNAVFLTGGGGKCMYPFIKDLDENLKVDLAKDPQMGNAFGYEKIAELMESQP